MVGQGRVNHFVVEQVSSSEKCIIFHPSGTLGQKTTKKKIHLSQPQRVVESCLLLDLIPKKNSWWFQGSWKILLKSKIGKKIKKPLKAPLRLPKGLIYLKIRLKTAENFEVFWSTQKRSHHRPTDQQHIPSLISHQKKTVNSTPPA